MVFACGRLAEWEWKVRVEVPVGETWVLDALLRTDPQLRLKGAARELTRHCGTGAVWFSEGLIHHRNFSPVIGTRLWKW